MPGLVLQVVPVSLLQQTRRVMRSVFRGPLQTRVAVLPSPQPSAFWHNRRREHLKIADYGIIMP